MQSIHGKRKKTWLTKRMYMDKKLVLLPKSLQHNQITLHTQHPITTQHFNDRSRYQSTWIRSKNASWWLLPWFTTIPSLHPTSWVLSVSPPNAALKKIPTQYYINVIPESLQMWSDCSRILTPTSGHTIFQSAIEIMLLFMNHYMCVWTMLLNHASSIKVNGTTWLKSSGFSHISILSS